MSCLRKAVLSCISKKLIHSSTPMRDGGHGLPNACVSHGSQLVLPDSVLVRAETPGQRRSLRGGGAGALPAVQEASEACGSGHLVPSQLPACPACRRERNTAPTNRDFWGGPNWEGPLGWWALGRAWRCLSPAWGAGPLP